MVNNFRALQPRDVLLYEITDNIPKHVVKKQEESIRSTSITFYWNISSCLFQAQQVWGHVELSLVPQMDQVVHELKSRGHRVIIFVTEEEMKTEMVSLSPKMKSILKMVDRTGAELYFGNPSAGIYIVDELACFSDIDSENEVMTSTEQTRNFNHITYNSPVSNHELSEIIQPRSFNHVCFTSNFVVKTSRAPTIRGELYFYKHIPKDIRGLFPELISHSTHRESGHVSLILSRINGIVTTHLFTSRQLNQEMLRSLFFHLKILHSSTGPADRFDNSYLTSSRLKNSDGKKQMYSPYCVNSSTNFSLNHYKASIYANYGMKIRSRYRCYIDLFHTLEISREFVHELVGHLDVYEQQNRGSYAHVIHGDAVFTNIISLSDSTFKFIDMRGSQGSVCTLEGDIVYDLGKLYQSICGYDFILQGLDTPDLFEINNEYISRLRLSFSKLLKDMYPGVKYEDILLVTSSLYLSLIPLHENFEHQRKFAKKAVELFNEYKEKNLTLLLSHPP